jgi:hypothetical protein
MYRISFRIPIIAMLLVTLSFPVYSLARADEMTCPEHTPVSIDIKPGSNLNRITLSSLGLVPVAVLTTADFDASQFSPEMAHLTDSANAMTNGCAGATAVRWTRGDVNNDGLRDLVFFFNTRDLDLTPSSIAADLMAHGVYGNLGTIHIMGTDSVKVKP